MKPAAVVGAVAIAAVVALGAIYFFEVEQTQEAKLPEVDVAVEGGQAPKFDIEAGSIEVGQTETAVTVPEVELTEKKVTVPTLEVKPAE